jgi:hypothetical protein
MLLQWAIHSSQIFLEFQFSAQVADSSLVLLHWPITGLPGGDITVSIPLHGKRSSAFFLALVPARHFYSNKREYLPTLPISLLNNSIFTVYSDTIITD